jgi:hypothetical protein
MTEPTNQASTADLSRCAISHQPLSAPPDHGRVIEKAGVVPTGD